MTSKRKAHWEQVYSTKNPDEVSWYQIRPNLSLELIEASGVALDAPLIDVGGGVSTLVDHLLENGYTDLSVLDISGHALQTAQRRLADKARQVTWIESDVTLFAPPRSYQLWHDRAVFHFLTDAGDRQAYLDAMKQGLANGGHLIIAAFALDGPEQCSGLPVRRYDAALMNETLGGEFELLEELKEGHQTPAGKVQQFCFYRYRYRA